MLSENGIEAKVRQTRRRPNCVSYHPSDDMLQKMRQAAVRENRSLSKIVDEAMKKYLQRRAKIESESRG